MYIYRHTIYAVQLKTLDQNLQDEPEGEKTIKLMISVFFIKGCTQENKCSFSKSPIELSTQRRTYTCDKKQTNRGGLRQGGLRA